MALLAFCLPLVASCETYCIVVLGVQNQQGSSEDSVCRLYEVGRSRRSDDDDEDQVGRVGTAGAKTRAHAWRERAHVTPALANPNMYPLGLAFYSLLRIFPIEHPSITQQPSHPLNQLLTPSLARSLTQSISSSVFSFPARSQRRRLERSWKMKTTKMMTSKMERTMTTTTSSTQLCPG